MTQTQLSEEQLRVVYNRWKDQPEFTWFYTVWLPQPIYPITFSKGQTHRISLVTRLLEDFGFQRSRKSGRLFLISVNALKDLNRRLTHLMKAQQQQPQKVPPSTTTRRTEDKTAEATLAGMMRDMAALTQERDKLRALLEEALKRVAECRKQQPPPRPLSSLPSLSEPPPPPPTPSLPAKTIPSVPKSQAADLLTSIRKGAVLKKATPLTPKKEENGGESSSLVEIIKKGAAARRPGIDGDEKEDDDEWTQASIGSECEVCYSAHTVKCADCKSVFYCGADCQRTHWQTHANVCNKIK